MWSAFSLSTKKGSRITRLLEKHLKSQGNKDYISVKIEKGD